MRPLTHHVRFALIAALAAATSAAPAQQQKSSPAVPKLDAVDLLTVKGRAIYEAAAAPGSRRIYYIASGDTVWMFDRDRKTSTMIARVSGAYNPAVSRAGDRLAFARTDEIASTSRIWMVDLTPAGLAAGAPRRISLSNAEYPAFSPDGRRLAYAAYDSNQSRLVVTSIDGGPERTLATTPRAWAPITWSADGRYIYMNENRAGPERPRIQFRVPVDGGPVERLATSSGGYPGLSPDGQHLVFESPPSGSPVNWIIADATGRELGRAAFSGGWDGWSGNTTILSGMTRRRVALRMMPVAGGPSLLIDSTLDVMHHAWSPDGKRFAAAGTDGKRTVIVLYNADGSGRRAIQVADSAPEPLLWSPDSRFIAYRATPAAVRLLDVAAGTSRELVRSPGAIGKIIWERNGGALRYVYIPSPALAAREVRSVSLTGAVRSLFPLITGKDSAGVGGTGVVFLSDTLAYVRHDSSGTLVSLTTGRRTPMPSINAQFASGVGSGDRIVGRNGQATSLAVLDVSGRGTVKSLPVPFRVGGNAMYYPVILPDRSHAVISGVGDDGRRAVHVVDLSTGQTRTLVTLADGAMRPWLSASPDGRQLLYTTTGNVTGALVELDLTRILKR